MSDAARAKALIEEFRERWPEFPCQHPMQPSQVQIDWLVGHLRAFAAEQTAALWAALKEEHHAAVMYRLLPDIAEDWLKAHKGTQCEVCALLADAGPRAEEKR